MEKDLTAAFSKTAHTGNIAKNRKEKHFFQQYSLVAITDEGLKEIVCARWYGATSTVYCCLWVWGGKFYTSGGGKAGGYGYHKGSADLQVALGDAGIHISEDIGGRGDIGMENALTAIGVELGYSRHKMKIFRAHA